MDGMVEVFLNGDESDVAVRFDKDLLPELRWIIFLKILKNYPVDVKINNNNSACDH